MDIFTLARRMGTSVKMIDQTYGHLITGADVHERELLDAFDRAPLDRLGTQWARRRLLMRRRRDRPDPGLPGGYGACVWDGSDGTRTRDLRRDRTLRRQRRVATTDAPGRRIAHGHGDRGRLSPVP